MKVEKEDVVSAAIAAGLLAWLFGLPELIWARLRGLPLPASRIYVPSAMKRVSNPGNVDLAELREELDRD